MTKKAASDQATLDLPPYHGRTPTVMKTSITGAGNRIAASHGIGDTVVLLVEAKVRQAAHEETDKDGLVYIERLKVVATCSRSPAGPVRSCWSASGRRIGRGNAGEPWEGYEQSQARDIIGHIKQLDTAEAALAVSAWEEEHGGRSSVMQAAMKRAAELGGGA